MRGSGWLPLGPPARRRPRTESSAAARKPGDAGGARRQQQAAAAAATGAAAVLRCIACVPQLTQTMPSSLRAAGGAAVRLSAKPFVTAALLLISAVCPRSARHVLFSGDTHVQAGLATPSGRLARGWLARAGSSARFSQAQKGVCKPTQVIRQRGGVAGGNVRQPRCALVGRRGAAGTGATTLCTYPHVRPCRHCRPCPSIMNVREARAVRKGTSRAVQNAKRRPLVACVPFTSHANWMPCLPSCKQSYTCHPHLRMLQLAMQQQAAVAVQRTRIALALLRLHLKTAGQIQCRRRPIAGLHVHCTASRGR